MFIRKLVVLAAVAAFGVLAVASSASAATTVLRTDPGNVRVPAGATVTGTSEGAATFSITGLGTFTCHSAFSLTASVTEGNPSVDGTLASLALTSCSDTIPVIDYDTCSAVSPFPTVTVAATSTAGGTVTLGNTQTFCHAVGTGTPGSGCYWLMTSPTGSFTNLNSTLAFVNVAVDHKVPTGATNDLGASCGTTLTFTARYSGVHTSVGALTLATS
jgi:hypothetical protein